MSTSNHASTHEASLQETDVTPTVPSMSSAAPAPPTPMLGGPRTERPMEPTHLYQPFIRKEDEATIGNPEMLFMLKLEGQLGIFYDRLNTTKIPTLAAINFQNLRLGAFSVLTQVIEQLILVEKNLDAPTVAQLVVENATQLANGVAVMTYLKLRSTNYWDLRTMNYFRRKPKVPVPFEVPLPYALAIAQLGKIKISGLPSEIFLSPTGPANIDETYGCPADNPWSPMAYSRAVAYAKKVGMRFSSVDLSVKMGSSWWLYRPVNEGENFALQCPYPEENFTVNTAVLASLFCQNVNNGFNNPIISLDSLGTDNFGTMLRSPPLHIGVNTYYAITESNEINYKVIN